jgi:SAM-dependent methyltransferase
VIRTVVLPEKIEFVKGRLVPIPTPLFSIFGQKLRTLALVKLFPEFMKWKLIDTTKHGFIAKHYNNILHMTPLHASIVVTDWRIWLKCYLPAFALKGKVILDVGAGCGETAHFYLMYGARKVIAVEPDSIAAKLLAENVRRNGWNVEIIDREFQLDDLNIQHDFMKMDGEGCEAALLELEDDYHLKPCVIECHNEALIKQLSAKFRMNVVFSFSGHGPDQKSLEGVTSHKGIFIGRKRS